MLRARILVTGLVQGVGFRSYVRNHAKDIGLKGFVRNTKSGRLEIVVEGYERQINGLMEKVNKGPFGSQIEDVRIEWEEPENKFKDFTVEN